MTRLVLPLCVFSLYFLAGCQSGDKASVQDPTEESNLSPTTPVDTIKKLHYEVPSTERTVGKESPGPTKKEPGKRALLVGINKYQRCRDLYGCTNDVLRMKAMLMNFYGFDESDILTLSNEEATRDAILGRFKNHLVDGTDQEGTVLFYFSGHGSQTRDVSGDETDLLDESLVAHDSRAPGGKDVLDDELNALLKLVAQKTSNCTVILDACHSGDGVRGIDAAKRVRMRAEDSLWYAGQNLRPIHTSWNIRDNEARYMLLTSSGASQLSHPYEPNNQGIHYSRYSYFLVEAIEHKLPVNGTYKDLHDLVYTDVITIEPRQYPTLEGSRIEHVFLGNEKVAHELFIRIEKNEEDACVINSGNLHGMTEGSEFDVYKAGTKSTKTSGPISKIRLTKVDQVQSVFEVIEGDPPIGGCLAHEVKHIYSESSIKVAILNKPNRKNRSFSFPDEIREASPIDAHLLFKYKSDSLLAYSRFDTITPVKSYALTDPNLEVRIRSLLSSWETWFYMKQLKNDDSELDITFSLTIVTLEGDSFDYYENPDYQLKPDERATIRISNNAEKPVFINVLDLPLDGSFNVLYPKYGRRIKLAPGLTWTKQVEATLDTDQKQSSDVLKLVVSERHIDYQSLVTRSKNGGLPPIKANRDFDWLTGQMRLEVVR